MPRSNPLLKYRGPKNSRVFGVDPATPLLINEPRGESGESATVEVTSDAFTMATQSEPLESALLGSSLSSNAARRRLRVRYEAP